MTTLTAVAVALVALGTLAAARTGDGLVRTTTVTDGVPLTVVRASGDAGARPGAVVVHGFAGSARLMLPFADTLARNGYVVVLPDLAGHGASTRRMADPLPDLDTAVRFLRAQAGVDARRIVLIGHSRGASAVSTYAGSHRDIAATVAISLGEAPERMPRNLLVLYGQREFPIFATAARETLERPDPTATVTTGRTYGSVADGSARRADPVPGVEHVSILFSGTAHGWTLAWLDAAVRPDSPLGTVHPTDRLWPAGLLLLGLLVGFVPLAGLLFRRPAAVAPRVTPVGPARVGVAMGAGLGAGAVVGVVANEPVLGLAVGGYTAVVLLAFGVAIALAAGRPRFGRPAWSMLARVGLLAGYATAMVAVPIQVGLTWVVPNVARLVPLVAVGVAVWVLFGAAERVAGGWWYLHGAVLAAAVGLLLALTVTGFGPGFLLLVLPLLVGLLAIGAGVAAVLRRLAVPPWLAAAVAAPVLAWTVATTLPLA
jgi:dienelactone hydrolase